MDIGIISEVYLMFVKKPVFLSLSLVFLCCAACRGAENPAAGESAVYPAAPVISVDGGIGDGTVDSDMDAISSADAAPAGSWLVSSQRGNSPKVSASKSTVPPKVQPSSAVSQNESNPDEVTLRIGSRANMDNIIGFLADKGVCTDKTAFIKAMEHGSFDYRFVSGIPVHKVYYRFEGYFYPDTYRFLKNSDPETVINILLRNFHEKVTAQHYADAEKIGMTMHEVITLASIVQLEGDGFHAEMPKIAAVFKNRLEQWPSYERYLGSDPTVLYPHGNGAYNTYNHTGLPPGPIGNPTVTAINAVLHSASGFSDYFYFVTDKNMKFYYTKTDEEHNAVILDLKNKGLYAQ